MVAAKGSAKVDVGQYATLGSGGSGGGGGGGGGAVVVAVAVVAVVVFAGDVRPRRKAGHSRCTTGHASRASHAEARG